MTKKEFLGKLKVVADMSDNQLATLANLLIEYIETNNKKEIGFKK